MFNADYDEIISIIYSINDEMNRIVKVQKSLSEKRVNITDIEISNKINAQINDLQNAIDNLYMCSSNIMKALYEK